MYPKIYPTTFGAETSVPDFIRIRWIVWRVKNLLTDINCLPFTRSFHILRVQKNPKTGPSCNFLEDPWYSLMSCLRISCWSFSSTQTGWSICRPDQGTTQHSETELLCDRQTDRQTISAISVYRVVDKIQHSAMMDRSAFILLIDFSSQNWQNRSFLFVVLVAAYGSSLMWKHFCSSVPVLKRNRINSLGKHL